ncbi:ABC transporter substrate-binding protein [Streptomyces sp. NPDC048717]|uniref:ABC transporter substrate-binding protein n=1 Tax=Streptomyces sp. NPDC048717 TaxID=3154928 RepID=UPI00344082C2
MPLNNDSHWPADYDARFVGEAATRTLLSEAADGNVVSGAAVGIEYRERDDCWSLELDTSLRWSDGARLTPIDCVRSVDRILGRPRSRVARMFPSTGAVRVVEGGRIEYRFSRPTSYAAALFTLPQLAPSRAQGTLLGAPALGDYALAYSDGGTIKMVRHPYVKDAKREAPEALIFRSYSSLDDALLALAQGEVDVSPTTSFGVRHLQEFSHDPRMSSGDISIFGNLEFGQECLAMRSRPDLRRALGLALDRRRIAGSSPGLVTPFCSQTAAWRDESEQSYDTRLEPTDRERDEIRRALGDEIIVPYADFTPNGDIVQAVCTQLQEVFGISAIPCPVSYQSYIRKAVTGRHGLLYTLTTADFAHPAALLLPWRSDSPSARRIAFADPSLDRYIDEASAVFDPAQAEQEWRRADKRWLELMPRVPLIQVRAHCLRGDRLNDVSLDSGGLVDFRQLEVRSV